jgi:phosphomannomutase/phosphoglucomutase
MPRLFGTAGARGVINREVTPEFAMRIAAAYTRLMCERPAGPQRPTLAVGHDTRYGAAALARAAAAGICSAGADAMEYHVIPTGAFCFHVRASGAAGGILITGSHMPPDRTGVIPILPDGAYAPFDLTDRIENALARFQWEALAVAPQDMGHPIEAFHPFESYISYVVQLVDARKIRARRFRVLCDPANGAASLVAKELFEWLGCAVEMIHYDPAPVPDRPSEPRAHTVHRAAQLVREMGLEAGFCFDVDADRCLVVDETGTPVSEDTLGAIFAKAELRAGDACVVPINSSGLIERVCASIGARLEYCPVGQPQTVVAIRRLGAVYSYEESGKYYFARHQLWTDGLFTAARLLEIMAKTGRSVSELAAEFPRFAQVKHTIPVPNDRKAALMERVRAALQTELVEGRRADYDLDGFKRVYDDDAWLLIRPSGTEEIVRAYSDAPSEARARELAARGAELVRRLLEEL